ncbi:YjcZ family sporulation protein [Neobacillus ginsengisoli]|nr:YjcZ family sporulation protein [Neobacillus ginsengisoli]
MSSTLTVVLFVLLIIVGTSFMGY